MKKIVFSGILASVVVGALALSTPFLEAQRGLGALGVVYVSSQDLYYDTFVSATSLPPRGPFQLLEGGVTEFGPGDQGYVGGRWKIPDASAPGGYVYLLCPLLGPGRAEP